MVAGPRWPGSNLAIPTYKLYLVTSFGEIGGSPAPMQRSVSLLVALGDNPVPLSVMDTCHIAVGGRSVPTTA